jgi:hypothetical protein
MILWSRAQCLDPLEKLYFLSLTRGHPASVANKNDFAYNEIINVVLELLNIKLLKYLCLQACGCYGLLWLVAKRITVGWQQIPEHVY